MITYSLGIFLEFLPEIAVPSGFKLTDSLLSVNGTFSMFGATKLAQREIYAAKHLL